MWRRRLYTNCIQQIQKTRRTLGGAYIPPTKMFRRLTGTVNKAMLKPRLAAAANTYTSDFPDIKFRVAPLKQYRRKQSSSGIRTIIRIGLKSQSVPPCPDMSTRNISYKSTHAFLSNVANRQTDIQIRAKTYTFSFVRGKNSICRTVNLLVYKIIHFVTVYTVVRYFVIVLSFQL